jgi:hypothetical protein
VVPVWSSTLLPLQDYPQLLAFARIAGDCTDPGSPFYGTYTTGWPLSPLVLPVALLRLLALASSIEVAGKGLISACLIALPLAARSLLRALGRNEWLVVPVVALSYSYWLSGGFFAFATTMPLLLTGLAVAIAWLRGPTWRSALLLAGISTALFLWHALVYAQLMFDFALLWLLWRAPGRRARIAVLWPLVPSVVLAALSMWTTVLHSPAGGPRGAAPAWPSLAANASQFFEYVGPIVPRGSAFAMLLLGVVALASLLALRDAPAKPSLQSRSRNPLLLCSLAAVACCFVLPAFCFGVEGVNNRQPWIAALFFVLGAGLPAGRRARA